MHSATLLYLLRPLYKTVVAILLKPVRGTLEGILFYVLKPTYKILNYSPTILHIKTLLDLAKTSLP